MSWVRTDDKFSEHPKIHSVGGEFRVSGAAVALTLQTRALCYCARNLTDGRLSSGIVVMLTHDLGGFGADEMVTAGLWDPDGGGWVVHDYLAYNPSRAQVESERAAAAERMKRVRRIRSASVRPNFSSPVPDPGTTTTPSIGSNSHVGQTSAPPEPRDRAQRNPKGTAPAPGPWPEGLPAAEPACPDCAALLRLLADASVMFGSLGPRVAGWVHDAHGVAGLRKAVEAVRLRIRECSRGKRKYLAPGFLFEPRSWAISLNAVEDKPRVLSTAILLGETT